MSDHRDRVVFQLDEHIKSVLQFMQENVPTAKLIGVAECLPEIGRLLWACYPQEPVKAVILEPREINSSCGTQQVAIG
jgi:hypothetical protein